MNYEEVKARARTRISSNCRVCKVCDGLACGNAMPGPGSKAPGNGANENYRAWQNVKLNMDTITEPGETDLSMTLFGRTLSLPVLTAPIGSIQKQFNPTDDVSDFNEQCMAACEAKGTLHAFGSGLYQWVWEKAIASSEAHGNTGIPVFNPDSNEEIRRLMDLYQNRQKPCASCVVVDSAGLPHLSSIMGGKGGTKSTADLKELNEYMGVPFIVKGIMTVKGARKAMEAGADAIIVSNHGGRVLSGTPATAEVLPEIAAACRGRVRILVDGGIRSGIDVFRALALGADAVLICRPVLIAYYGAGAEGISIYLDQIKAELKDAMYMCGAHSLSEITGDMIRHPYGGTR
ncbi:MAG: alpha-hydroxy-acid oxidizing protein [Solobacterium sp.]|nr:alpha-hydroxy-acid oxidizing protein [Solobacterium sp.]